MLLAYLFHDAIHPETARAPYPMQYSRVTARAEPSTRIARTLAIICAAMHLLLLTACGSISPRETPKTASGSNFKTEAPKTLQEFATPERIAAVTPYENFRYRIGPGDVLSIQIWKRPEISQAGVIVSPDGKIVLPRIGSIAVLEHTPEEVEQTIIRKLEYFYIKPEVSVRIQEYHNNKAFVLGRVSKPGVVNFPGKGTLLEALALAGGIPDQRDNNSLTKCAIIRGSDTIIWIDLEDLLRNGNMALNAPVRNNDIIYIPEASDELVYVLGEVIKPGAIQIKSGMNVMKAIMLAGGMNKSANPEKIFVIRQQNAKGEVTRVDLKNLLEHGNFSANYALLPEDIVFVSPSGMAKFNYALEKLLPSLQMLNLGTTNLETFGVMQELRKKLWGQEGFVNSSGD